MKTLKTSAIVVMLTLLLVLYSQRGSNTRSYAPQPRPPQFGVDLWYSIGVILLVALALLLLAAIFAAIVWLLAIARNKRKLVYPEAGLFPVLTLDTTSWRQRLRGHRQFTFVPLAMLADPATVHIADGEMTISGVRSDWTASYQLQIAQADHRTRQVAASMTNGGGVRHAAHAKLLAGTYDRERSPRVVEVTSGSPNAPTAVQEADLAHLVAASQRERIAFGQQPDTGELAVWDVQETPHLRLHGGTQKGKTSGAMTIAACLLARHWHVVVLDPRRFKNWHMAGDWAELIDVAQPDAFAEALAAIHGEYRRRDLLLGENSAKDIADLRTAIRPPRLAVIIEEYGAQRARARAAGTLETVDHHMSVLASEAAADGIHLIAIDQRPTEYHPFVKANLGGVIIFPLPDGAGRAAGYARAHELLRYHFWYDGGIYRSVDAPTNFESVVRRAGPATYPHVALEKCDTTRAIVHGTADTHEPQANAFMNGQMNGTVNAWSDDVSRWQPLVDAWFAEHPDALVGPATGISAIARRMAVADSGSEQGFENYKSIAHKLFHEFRGGTDVCDGEGVAVRAVRNDK